MNGCCVLWLLSMRDYSFGEKMGKTPFSSELFALKNNYLVHDYAAD